MRSLSVAFLLYPATVVGASAYAERINRGTSDVDGEKAGGGGGEEKVFRTKWHLLVRFFFI